MSAIKFCSSNFLEFKIITFVVELNLISDLALMHIFANLPHG